MTRLVSLAFVLVVTGNLSRIAEASKSGQRVLCFRDCHLRTWGEYVSDLTEISFEVTFLTLMPGNSSRAQESSGVFISRRSQRTA